MLTAKQELFAQNIVQGMTQADAYRSAYDAENMSDNAIYVEACRLADNPNVALRVKELRDQLANPVIMSAQERLEWLSRFVNAGAMFVLSAEKIRAIDTMNKMTGEYVTKVEADVSGEMTITVELVDE